MKTLNSTVKIIAALCIIGALFFSCSINDADKHGTLTIKLPGSDSARAASPDFTDFTDLKYRIVCSGSDEVSLDAGSGDFVSITLLPGKWTVTLTVSDSTGQDIGSSKPETAVIESGKTTSVSIYVALDEYPYFGDTLYLSGQVYGGDHNDYNPNKLFIHGAKVYSEGIINENGVDTNGKLDFTIKESPQTQSIFTTGSEEMEMLNSWYSGVNVIPNDVEGTFLSLRAISHESRIDYVLIRKEETTTSYPPMTITKNVEYIYVNKDVTITANGNTTFPYKDILITTSNLNLKLKKGWNAIYREIKTTEGVPVSLGDISLRNPDIKWVLPQDGMIRPSTKP